MSITSWELPAGLLSLLQLREQARIAHWRTDSYALHKATDWLQEVLDAHLDRLVETWQGTKDRRVTLPGLVCTLELGNDLVALTDVLERSRRELLDWPASTSPHLVNLRDEIVADLLKFNFLLSLK